MNDMTESKPSPWRAAFIMAALASIVCVLTLAAVAAGVWWLVATAIEATASQVIEWRVGR